MSSLDFVPGTNWVAQMQEGTRAERTIVLLSDAYLHGSEFGAAEWYAAFREDPVGAQRKLIPIRIEPCERPGLLGPLTGFDLFDLEEAAAKQILIDKIDTAIRAALSPLVSRPSLERREGIRQFTSSRAFPWRRVAHLAGTAAQSELRRTARATEPSAARAGLDIAGDRPAVRGMGGVATQLRSIRAPAVDRLRPRVVHRLRESPCSPMSSPLSVPHSDWPRATPTASASLCSGTPDVQRWLIIFDTPTGPRRSQLVPHQPLVRPVRLCSSPPDGCFGARVGRRPRVITAGRSPCAHPSAIDRPQSRRIADSLLLAPRVGQAAAYLDRSQQPPSESRCSPAFASPTCWIRAREHRAETTVATLWSLSLAQLPSTTSIRPAD